MHLLYTHTGDFFQNFSKFVEFDSYVGVRPFYVNEICAVLLAGDLQH